MNSDTDLLLQFLHTRQTPDPLRTSSTLKAWLADHRLPSGSEPSPEDIALARHVRAALADVLRRGDVAWSDSRTRDAIESVAAGAMLRIAVGRAGDLRLAAVDDGVRGALAEIIAAYYRVSLQDDRERLKACDACGWAFFDVSKNKSRRWCDMGLCGSQHKSRAYRARKSVGTPGA